MNLQHLTDETLLNDTEQLVSDEREILIRVLHHLREIERRRLFSALKFKSLHDFAVKHLHYSGDQAYRRISAMRLLKEFPQITSMIQDGSIGLTHLNMASGFFKREKKFDHTLDAQAKLHLLQQLGNTTTRQAEKIVIAASAAPAPLSRDVMRAISLNQIELKFVADESVECKIRQLKGILAHRFPRLDLGELFRMLCDLGLESWDPALQRKSAAPRKSEQAKSQAEMKRQVFQDAKSRCENCQSAFAIEIDHRLPQSLGGTSERQNLRILCRSCNQRAAIEQLGVGKMDPYLN